MFDKLKGLLSGGGDGPLASAESLRPGRAVLVGVVGADSPLSSPILHKPCAAFYYRSTYTTPSRIKGFIRQKLRDALVYGEELFVTLSDGTKVQLVAPKHDAFDAAAHRALKAHGYDGFDAKEQRIDLGATVHASGSLKTTDGVWKLKLTSLEKVADAPRKATSPSSTKSGGESRRPRGKKRKKKR
jgi:hypothetical protein